ncbi:MAG: SMP-30/gluconolactonase/LRE family protein [Lentisphaeraceae bacterium]|nr:SMP-30/gluconolactonase/LRE family protein [Lentisphaeraceae bacterium]
MLKNSVLFIICGVFLFSCKTTSDVFTPTQQLDIVSSVAKLEKLWDKGTFTEGPTPDHEGNILFTDIRSNRIMKYDRKTGQTTVFKSNSNGANGLLYRKGKLYSCEGAGMQFASVAVTETNGEKTLLAGEFRGKKLNSPNDLVMSNNGLIYFTDPRYGSTDGKELDFEGVFLIKRGETILATKDTERPNGILISHDQQTLYVADNNNQPGGARSLLKFDIANDGTLTNKKVLFAFKDHQRGIDGMAMDDDGNIYATAGKGAESGIYVFSADGAHLAFIELPDIPTNCTFGGPGEENYLYITCQVNRQPHTNKKFGLFRIELNKSAK